MIISARRVKRSRERRACNWCGMGISMGAPCISAYGSSDYGANKPYRLWMHEECVSNDLREFLHRKKKVDA